MAIPKKDMGHGAENAAANKATGTNTTSLGVNEARGLREFCPWAACNGITTTSAPLELPPEAIRKAAGLLQWTHVQVVHVGFEVCGLPLGADSVSMP